MLDMRQKQALTAVILKRYKKASKKEKGEILDEFIENTGYNRSYARRILGSKKVRHRKEVEKKKQQRKKVYEDDVVIPLKKIWIAANCICGKRLAPFMKETIRILERDGELVLDVAVKEKLIAISRSTIDRLLKKVRRSYQLKGKATTKPGTLLKHSIPLKTFTEWNDTVVGFVEMDLVAFCGESVKGDYVNGLNVVDVATGWTSLEAVLGKGQHGIHDAVERIRQRLPFYLLGIHSDNGSEFINDIMYRYCKKHTITFTRSRPYKKNDNCYVEQKNYTVLRGFVGYGRYDTQEQLLLVKQLLVLVEDYVNFFQPSAKLISKERNGSKVKKRHDIPQTPYQRLLLTDVLTQDEKQRLQEKYESLNPMKLKREMNKIQEKLLKTLRYNLVESTIT